MQISDAVFTNLAERGPCSAAEAACQCVRLFSADWSAPIEADFQSRGE